MNPVGAVRDELGGWPASRKPEQLRQQVDDNLRGLGLDVLDLVYLRLGNAMGPVDEPVGEAMTVLAELQAAGKIRHLGVSNATTGQIEEAQRVARVESVQNMYNLAYRADDHLIDRLAADGVAFVPFFPLGGFSPVQSEALSAVATRLEASPMAVALAWLLRRSPNVLLIPGTSKAAHLRENATGAALELSESDLAELDRIGG